MPHANQEPADLSWLDKVPVIHHYNTSNRRSTWLTESKAFSCTHEGCNKSFYEKKNLRRHENQKHGRKPVKKTQWNTFVMAGLEAHDWQEDVSFHGPEMGQNCQNQGTVDKSDVGEEDNV